MYIDNRIQEYTLIVNRISAKYACDTPEAEAYRLKNHMPSTRPLITIFSSFIEVLRELKENNGETVNSQLKIYKTLLNNLIAPYRDLPSQNPATDMYTREYTDIGVKYRAYKDCIRMLEDIKRLYFIAD